MTVHLVNFHCIVNITLYELIKYEFVKQLQKGGPWTVLVVLR